MIEPPERLWDYDAVEPGQSGPPTMVAITRQNVAEYARLSQNPDYAGGPLAMPTMVISYAPLLRSDIAESNGYLALEESRTSRRQTPFAKCEARWFKPVQVGDTITGNRRVLEKYQRRGSKFVVFRIEATNQVGDPIAEYDYTCIFEYAGGQRAGPAEPVAPVPAPPAVTTLPAGGLSYGSASVGDQLATLTITESQAVINRRNEFRLAGKVSASNIHTDEEFARQNIFGGTVNAGPATMSYVDQMLQRSFPPSAFYRGGTLLMRAITPFRSGDTVTFQGRVTGKRQNPSVPPDQDGSQWGILECRVEGNNQRGELVCLADAAMVMAV